MDDDLTRFGFAQQNVHVESRSATQVHYVSQTLNMFLPQDATLRDETSMMQRHLQECDIAAVGSPVVA